MIDKREGGCRPVCLLPRRCWAYVTCFFYGEGNEKIVVPAAAGGEDGSIVAARAATDLCGDAGGG